MTRFDQLNPEDTERDHARSVDHYESHDAYLDRRYRFDPSWSPRTPLTPQERSALYGIGMIDEALGDAA